MLAVGSKYPCDSLIYQGTIMPFVAIEQEINLLGTRARHLRDKDPDKLLSMTKESSFTRIFFLP